MIRELDLYCLGSKVNLAGQYRSLIEASEEKKRNYFETEMLTQFQPGDHQWLWDYHMEYQRAQLEHIKAGGDLNETVSLREYREKNSRTHQ